MTEDSIRQARNVNVSPDALRRHVELPPEVLEAARNLQLRLPEPPQSGRMYFNTVAAVLTYRQDLAGAGDRGSVRGRSTGGLPTGRGASGFNPQRFVEACVGGSFVAENKAGRDRIAVGVVDYVENAGQREGLDGLLLTALSHLRSTNSDQFDRGVQVWAGTAVSAPAGGAVAYNCETGEVVALPQSAFDPSNDPFSGGLSTPAFEQALNQRSGGQLMDSDCQMWGRVIGGVGGSVLGSQAGAFGGFLGGSPGGPAGMVGGAIAGGIAGGLSGWGAGSGIGKDTGDLVCGWVAKTGLGNDEQSATAEGVFEAPSAPTGDGTGNTGGAPGGGGELNGSPSGTSEGAGNAGGVNGTGNSGGGNGVDTSQGSGNSGGANGTGNSGGAPTGSSEGAGNAGGSTGGSSEGGTGNGSGDDKDGDGKPDSGFPNPEEYPPPDSDTGMSWSVLEVAALPTASEVSALLKQTAAGHYQVQDVAASNVAAPSVGAAERNNVGVISLDPAQLVVGRAGDFFAIDVRSAETRVAGIAVQDVAAGQINATGAMHQ